MFNLKKAFLMTDTRLCIGPLTLYNYPSARTHQEENFLFAHKPLNALNAPHRSNEPRSISSSQKSPGASKSNSFSRPGAR